LPSSFAELHIVLFPAGALPLAKECWQHTGMGISSRYAEHCLSLIPEESAQHSPLIVSHPTKVYDEHYFDNCVGRGFSPSPLTSPTEYLSKDRCDYLGERYGYTAVAGSAATAKRALRQVIKDINKQQGTTVFLTSHDVGDIEEVCERTMIVNHGRIMLDAKTAYVLDVVTPYSEHVLPFIPAGRTVADMIWRHEK